MSVADAITALSPSAYWKLDETTGTNFNDEIGVNDGTAVGSPVVNQASITPGDTTGKSVQFVPTGGDDGISFGDIYDFTGTTHFTALCFIRPVTYDGVNGHFLWANRDASANGWSLETGNPAVTFWMRRGDAAGFDEVGHTIAEATYEDGNTKMVSMRFDGTNLVLNIDGSDVVSSGSSKSVTAAATNTSLYFGEYGGTGSGFDGYADNLAIWSGTALSESQLAGIWAAGSAPISLQTAFLSGVGW